MSAMTFVMADPGPHVGGEDALMVLDEAESLPPLGDKQAFLAELAALLEQADVEHWVDEGSIEVFGGTEVKPQVADGSVRYVEVSDTAEDVFCAFDAMAAARSQTWRYFDAGTGEEFTR